MQGTEKNGRVRAVIYARVSSKEQEREGFSITAQLELLRTHAREHDFEILQEFQDVESASKVGRTAFGEMLRFVQQKKQICTTILVEKSDRLYRNLKDYVKIEDAAVTVHFVKENSVLSPNSKSNDDFIHGVNALIARRFAQNLGEEAHKGMRQKAKSGLFPSFAPVGYRNVEENGKRVIVPDSDAPTITHLFEEFSGGAFSLSTLAAKSREEGLTLRGRSIYKSELHQILRKRIYSGDFDWDGVTYQGLHDPIVTFQVWEKVQAILNGRAKSKQRRVRHDFAFSGFLRCGHCDCAMVGERKKEKYLYYHCTGHRGKCNEPYAKEEAIREQFGTALRDLVIPREVLAWLNEAVGESDVTERAARDRALQKLEEQQRHIELKLERLYDDRLDGRVTTEMHDKKASDLRTSATDLRRRIEEMRAAAPVPVREAIDLMDLTSRAADLFAVQPVDEQQRFLRLVLKTGSWKDRQLRVEFDDPFEALRRSNQLSRTNQKENTMPKPQTEIWLPGMDSNLD